MYIYIWRHSKSFSSWSMLDEPHIYKEQYLQADVAVLALSQTEALAILAQSDTWSIEDLQRLEPEIIPVTEPRIIISHVT